MYTPADSKKGWNDDEDSRTCTIHHDFRFRAKPASRKTCIS